MKVIHQIVGYDPQSECERFALEIPEDDIAAVKNLVNVNDDDPAMFDSYKLSPKLAETISRFVTPDPLPSDLVFFLEAYATRTNSRSGRSKPLAQKALAAFLTARRS